MKIRVQRNQISFMIWVPPRRDQTAIAGDTWVRAVPGNELLLALGLATASGA